MAIERESARIHKVQLSEQLHQSGSSALKRYRQKAVGVGGLLPFVYYELATLLLGDLAGGLGYQLRKWFYPRLFQRMGRGVILGKGVTLRSPARMSIGDRVAIDDYVFLDAGGAGSEGLVLEEDVIISRGCVVQAKTGPVRIGKRADIGVHTVISSLAGITIGESVLIAGNCYIGGGRYLSDHLDIPMMDQGLYTKGPVTIGEDVWLGAGVIALDGVRIGRGCIVGAGAVVTKDLPEYAIATGIPAVIRGFRGSGSAGETGPFKAGQGAPAARPD